jgi:chromosome 03 contig 1, DNA sequence
MDTTEYDAAVDTGALFAAHDTIQSDLEECKAKRAEQAASRQARGEFISQLEAINSRLKACGETQYQLGETFFVMEETGWGACTIRHLYTEEAVAKAEARATGAEEKRAMREAKATWEPQFKEAAQGYSFPEGKDAWGDSSLRFYGNVVSVGIKTDGKSYEYSEEGFAQFKADLPAYEEKYQEILREKAEAEAKAKAKAEEEACRAQAEAEAKIKKEAAEAEAKELGLPGDIRLWHRDGATNAGEAWVIGPNGMERDCDFVDTMVCGSNSKRYHQKYEGDHVWNQILPGELVLYWSHAYTAAPHKFEVIYRPETLTEAQLERVAEIQNGIEEQFLGKAGLVSARSCPSIGQGWGLFHRKEAVNATDAEEDCDEQSDNGSGATLGQLFGDIFKKLNS